MSPRVSIVLPCYNGEAHLAKSIESCIEQTFSDWELIIVDDASTDGSLAVMQQYAASDSRISIIRNSHNLRLPASLNRGFAQSRGEYLTWTSHDNRMAPDMLASFVDYLDAHPESGMVTASYDAFDLSDGHLLYEVHHPDPMQFMPLFNTVCYAFMYRRVVMESVGEYDVSKFLVEDYDYWVRIWQNYHIAKIDRVLYHTGVGNSTLTSAHRASVAVRLLELRKCYFSSFDSALRPYPSLRRRLYVQMADSMSFGECFSFVLKRGWHFSLDYFFLHIPYSSYRKLKNKISALWHA